MKNQTFNDPRIDRELFSKVLNGFDLGFQTGFVSCLLLVALVAVLYLSFNV